MDLPVYLERGKKMNVELSFRAYILQDLRFVCWDHVVCTHSYHSAFIVVRLS
jgi:hypothetical protein